MDQDNYIPEPTNSVSVQLTDMIIHDSVQTVAGAGATMPSNAAVLGSLMQIDYYPMVIWWLQKMVTVIQIWMVTTS
jgi:predicted glycosyltransferase